MAYVRALRVNGDVWSPPGLHIGVNRRIMPGLSVPRTPLDLSFMASVESGLAGSCAWPGTRCGLGQVGAGGFLGIPPLWLLLAGGGYLAYRWLFAPSARVRRSKLRRAKEKYLAERESILAKG